MTPQDSAYRDEYQLQGACSLAHLCVGRCVDQQRDQCVADHDQVQDVAPLAHVQQERVVHNLHDRLKAEVGQCDDLDPRKHRVPLRGMGVLDGQQHARQAHQREGYPVEAWAPRDGSAQPPHPVLRAEEE